MCQVQENDYKELVTIAPTILNGICNKCEEKAIILIGTNGKFCRSCFLAYFTHKLRGALGKHGTVRYNDKVVLAFSGGPSSNALLHCLLQELSPENPKKLKFTVDVIFIDESSILNEDIEQEIKNIKDILNHSKLSYHIVKIEEVDVNTDDLSLKSKIDALKSLTAKEEMLHKLRYRLIAQKSIELGYAHVFMAETSTRLAINILSSIAQGRGMHVAQDTAFCDSLRFPGINILRPIRDISSKEIAVYNAINRVQSVSVPTFTTGMSAKSSVRRATEEFVLGLTRNFPATETTVYRTANKLKSTWDSNESCKLCGGRLDSKNKLLKTTAEDALSFTENLSVGSFGSHAHSKLTDDLLQIRTLSQDKLDILTKQLCHSCCILKQEFQPQTFDSDFSMFYVDPSMKFETMSVKDMERNLQDCLITE